MSFQHACFVSYSHGNKMVVQGFINQLKEALDAQLETYFKKAQFGKSDKDSFYFIDDQRISTGSIVDSTIATAIFDSVCMVVAFWPSYEYSDYCLRELQGMKEVTTIRRKACRYPEKTDSLILPIYFKYCEEKPTIFGVEGLDVSKLFLATGNLSRMEEFWAEIDRICAKIKKHFDSFCKQSSDLESVFKERRSFSLPGKGEEMKTRKKLPLMSRSRK